MSNIVVSRGMVVIIYEFSIKIIRNYLNIVARVHIITLLLDIAFTLIIVSKKDQS